MPPKHSDVVNGSASSLSSLWVGALRWSTMDGLVCFYIIIIMFTLPAQCLNQVYVLIVLHVPAAE
jgi:hypothetical protein